MAEIVNVGMGDDSEEKNSFLILYSTEAKLDEKLAVLLPSFWMRQAQRWSGSLPLSGRHGVSGCNIHDHSGSLCGSVRFCDAGIQCVGSCGDISA